MASTIRGSNEVTASGPSSPTLGNGRRVRPTHLVSVGAAIGVAYIALAATFSLLTPAWENNDEQDHVRYIEHVAAHGGSPRIALRNGIESHQAPLYYYLAAGWQRLLGIDSFIPDVDPIKNPSGPPNELVHQVSHDYGAEQHHQAVAVHELRVLSIALGLTTVLSALLAGWLLTRSVAFSAALGATVALWPKFLVVTSAVTNTALVDALCAVSVPCFLLWQGSRRRSWAAATGLVLGAAVLAQITAIPIAALILLLMIGLSWKDRDWQTPSLAVACFASVCGWWFVRNVITYGDPLASDATQRYLSHAFGIGIARDPPSLSLSVVWDGLQILAHSTWYDGGWNQLQLPPSLDFVVLVIAAGCLAAAFLSPLPEKLLLSVCIIGSIISWLLLVRAAPQAEGRYLFVAIIAWAAVLVAGASRISRGGIAGLWAWPVIFTALDIYVLITWVIPNAQL